MRLRRTRTAADLLDHLVTKAETPQERATLAALIVIHGLIDAGQGEKALPLLQHILETP